MKKGGGGGGGGERAVAKGGGEEGVGEGVAVERETGRHECHFVKKLCKQLNICQCLVKKYR